MMQEDTYKQILLENEKRWDRLRADYDPVTGKGLAELTGIKTVKLELLDFAVHEKWIPE